MQSVKFYWDRFSKSYAVPLGGATYVDCPGQHFYSGLKSSSQGVSVSFVDMIGGRESANIFARNAIELNCTNPTFLRCDQPFEMLPSTHRLRVGKH